MFSMEHERPRNALPDRERIVLIESFLAAVGLRRMARADSAQGLSSAQSGMEPGHSEQAALQNSGKGKGQ